MPAKDDLLPIVHVPGENASGGDGTVNTTLNEILPGTFNFSGDEWIVVSV